MMKSPMLAVLLFASASLAWAVEPSEMLEDPVLEQRARQISKGLRCLVCQNQSIDESDAELAKDLRILVRERLVDGDSDEQAIDFVVSRYGDFVLLDPPFKMSTFALWLGPLGIAGIAGLFYFNFYRRRSDETVPTPVLSEDERKRLENILAEAKAGKGLS